MRLLVVETQKDNQDSCAESSGFNIDEIVYAHCGIIGGLFLVLEIAPPLSRRASGGGFDVAA